MLYLYILSLRLIDKINYNQNSKMGDKHQVRIKWKYGKNMRNKYKWVLRLEK